MVIKEIISILNKKAIIPDLIGFDIQVTPSGVEEKYGKRLQFNTIQISADYFNKLTEMRKIWLNIWVKLFYQSKYDLVINSNNTSCLLSGKNILNYIHFPRYERILNQEYFQTHKKIKLITRIAVKLDYALAGVLHRFFPPDNSQRFISNSNFTRSKLSIFKNIDNASHRTIYPPSLQLGDISTPKKENFVASVGRFSETKNQLMQIEIAKNLPELDFYIIGFTKEENPYFQYCKKLIRQYNLTNVHILTNLNYHDLMMKLERAKYFLHTTVNEPFGITTVQAISKNCIPVVHNSGGQKEIVFFRELRFENVSEAVSRFKELSEKELKDHRERLTESLENYSSENFIKTFSLELKQYFK